MRGQVQSAGESQPESPTGGQGTQQEADILTEAEVTQAQGTRVEWHSGLQSIVESSN